jgi:CAAX prenyl protease-like protein
LRVRLLQKIFAGSPAIPRVAPLLIFLALTFCQGKLGAASAYWFYLAKTVAGAWLVWEMRPLVLEMRWAFSWEAVLAGIGIFAVWVGLDPFYPHLMKGGATGDPNGQFGAGSMLAWFFIIVHILGMTFVVPPLEEVFYRSFFYRYLVNQNFLSVPLNRFLPLPFVATALVFGFSHNEWLAGILCGAAYQWLVIRRNRLGDAMTAHAITNLLLGVWIVWRGAWHFW